MQNAASIPEGKACAMKKTPKRGDPRCRHAGRSFPGNGDLPLSAEMEPSTQFAQKGNIIGKHTIYSQYSHPRAHLKFKHCEGSQTKSRELFSMRWNARRMRNDGRAAEFSVRACSGAAAMERKSGDGASFCRLMGTQHIIFTVPHWQNGTYVFGY